MNFISKRDRPFHLGKYPMEKIKRVQETTTLISDDVPRVPKRSNFFSRVAKGDLGEKAYRERFQMGLKSPIWRAIMNVCKPHFGLMDGEVADTKAPIPEDLQEIMKGATAETAFVHWLKQKKMNAEALAKFKEYGVKIIKTPDEINMAFLKSWDKIAEREAKKDPLVRKVLESQRNYARLVQSYRLTLDSPYEFAARYYYEK